MSGLLIALCVALAFVLGGLVSAWILALVAMANHTTKADQ